MSTPQNENSASINVGQDAPAWLKVNPAWKCAGIQVNPPPGPQEAFDELNRISLLMYGHPCPDPPTGAMAVQLQGLLSGQTAMNAIASLCTEAEFVQLIWGVAVGAAFDHCVQLLGVSGVKAITDCRQGCIDGFFQEYLASGPSARGALDFGWIIASLLSSQPWADLNLSCNAIPAPPPQTEDDDQDV